MKKLFLAVATLLSTVAMAQTEQGSYLAGGGFQLLTGKNSNQVAFNPTFGYFFADNFVAGANLGLNFAKQGTISTSELGIGPFARYYFGATNTKPFLVSEVNLLSSSSKSGTNKITNSGTSFLFGLGFAAFINETVAVEGLTGYRYSKYKSVDGSGGFNIRFGFGLYFNRSSVSSLKTNVMGQN